MTLVEWYFDNGTSGLTSTVILPVTQWKVKFVSGGAAATGSSSVTTTSEIYFKNSLNGNLFSDITAQTSSTSTYYSSQQYPAGQPNSYFYPVVNNTVEVIQVYIQNAAGVDGNYALFAIEVDLDGDFDE